MTLGALFDLDGVLIDSERLYTQYWAEVGVRFSIPSPTFALDIKGTTLKDIFSKYFPSWRKLSKRGHTFASSNKNNMIMEDKYYDDYEDNYGSNYGEYAGTYAQNVAGYSDDVINDAFDGEPDAYWNID